MGNKSIRTSSDVHFLNKKTVLTNKTKKKKTTHMLRQPSAAPSSDCTTASLAGLSISCTKISIARDFDFCIDDVQNKRAKDFITVLNIWAMDILSALKRAFTQMVIFDHF